MAKNTEQNTANLKEPWKKGETGNPNGRPKGRKNFKTLYYEAIERIAQSQGLTGEEWEVKFVEQAVRKGFNGDRGFYSDTMDRVHGKAEQHIDHTTGGEKIAGFNFIKNDSNDTPD